MGLPSTMMPPWQDTETQRNLLAVLCKQRANNAVMGSDAEALGNIKYWTGGWGGGGGGVKWLNRASQGMLATPRGPTLIDFIQSVVVSKTKVYHSRTDIIVLG